MVRKVVLALGIATMTLTAAACNTVRGVGQDVESVADDVDAAT